MRMDDVKRNGVLKFHFFNYLIEYNSFKHQLRPYMIFTFTSSFFPAENIFDILLN